MNNDLINRKVAVIEGWKHDNGIWRDGGSYKMIDTLSIVPPYSTNWHLCGPLIEKYDIDLNKFPTGWSANAVGNTIDNGVYATPQLAICLAVIAWAKAMEAAG